ncbi:predicted protein [Nematostella vectensis]|uniref:Uncharacterized protein n=1 Tax=Nematostella vectensis TaxID=45351 RepID=A7T7E7_NEMVE|nr:predicted protein [Nematostella vectensis]|eukprot:XP_001620204.1 hypothetical protein NEMVEDRAFT_v1g248798 [Nematostella vectensis]
MAGVFLCPQTCGFGKVIALQVAREVEKALPRESGESTTKYNARVKGEQYRKYRSYFPPQVTGDAFDIEFLKFHRKLPGLRNAMNKWNTRKAEEKSKFMETFSREKWQANSIPLPTHLLRIDQDDGTTLRIRIDPESVPADTRNASDETSEEDENAVSITLAPDKVVCHNAGFPLPEEVPPVPLIATADIMDATESEDENVVGITLARDEVVCIDPDLPPPEEKHANEGNSTTSLPTSLTPEPATRTTDSSTELTSRLGKALEIVVGKTTETFRKKLLADHLFHDISANFLCYTL